MLKRKRYCFLLDYPIQKQIILRSWKGLQSSLLHNLLELHLNIILCTWPVRPVSECLDVDRETLVVRGIPMGRDKTSIWGTTTSDSIRSTLSRYNNAHTDQEVVTIHDLHLTIAVSNNATTKILLCSESTFRFKLKSRKNFKY